MSDLDRFAAFLRGRVAEAYHAPPETPRDAMWQVIAGAIAGAIAAGEGQYPGAPWPSGDPELPGLPVTAASYHAPPATPHDDMWGRIEAAWTLRRSAPPAGREAGLDALPASSLAAGDPGDAPAHPAPVSGEGWLRGLAIDRRRLAAVGAVLAAAASLVIGIAIGRGSVDGFGGGDPAIVAAGPEGARPGRAADAGTPLAEGGLLAEGATSTGLEDDAASGFEPLESAPAPSRTRLVTAGPETTARPEATRPLPSARSSRDVAIGYATAKHLGRAETLLTSFRADVIAADEAESPDGDRGTVVLAEWARDLLADTRLLLDLADDRPAGERALLEDLELVLAQIARLGPEAPAFERDLVADEIDRDGTIARLRAAAPPGASATRTGI